MPRSGVRAASSPPLKNFILLNQSVKHPSEIIKPVSALSPNPWSKLMVQTKEAECIMGGIRNSPTYLYQNESGYYFRIVIPCDIRRFFNKSELKCSLRTGTLATAKRRSRAMVSITQSVIKNLRRGGQMSELASREINKMVRDYYYRILDEDKQKRIESGHRSEDKR